MFIWAIIAGTLELQKSQAFCISLKMKPGEANPKLISSLEKTMKSCGIGIPGQWKYHNTCIFPDHKTLHTVRNREKDRKENYQPHKKPYNNRGNDR